MGASVNRRARFILRPPPSTYAGLQINFKGPRAANKQRASASDTGRGCSQKTAGAITFPPEL